MSLDDYRRKRDFERTPEPRGAPKVAEAFSFVVQKHAARRLHYDFRLELDGVLLSWAIPRGPSLSPRVRRLAVHTEDHPIEYGTFEGVIPAGEYGGGTVLVWDRGRWIPEGDPREGYRRGRLRFALEGEKLKGAFTLVKTTKQEGAAESWLLIKRSDGAARTEGVELVDEAPQSVLSGRTIEEIAADPDRVWHSNRTEDEPTPSRGLPDVSELPGARRGEVPLELGPELPSASDQAPATEEWLHEIKLDGYRVIARLDGGRAELRSRNGLSFTDRLPSLVRTIEALPLTSAVFDGEVVVLRADGKTDFQLLQNSLGAGRDEHCTYFAFDLLALDGIDLRGSPLLLRKEALRHLLAAVGASEGRIRYGDHLVGKGEAFYRRACDLGLEGVVSKRLDAPYRSGRSKAWRKTKCLARQEFVIGGYTDPGGSRAHFGALLLGTYENGSLVYAGKVGIGFSDESLAELSAKLAPLETSAAPFRNPPRGPDSRGVHWVEPTLVAEVEFTAFTSEGMVRHAAFRGLREDKRPEEVFRENTPSDLPGILVPPAEVHEFVARAKLSNPEKVLYPESGITKHDLAEYYAEVGARILPHVAGRPLTLVRCPNGHHRHCFYQKHRADGAPPSIRPIDVKEDSAEPYMTIDDVDGLLALVQLGVLELHTWGAHADRPDRPDQLVFDLDPDADLAWERVVEGARRIRERLDELGLVSFVKTTGGKGLHVVVPIARRTPWDEAKQFTKALAEGLVRAEPNRYLAVMTKAKRRGKIFLDYLRNGRGATAIAAYSTRARSGATVSMPVAWDELDEIRGDTFDIESARRRLRTTTPDPWHDFFDVKQSITAAMQRAVGRK